MGGAYNMYGERRYNVSMGKREEKRPLEIARHRW
jgi:hypothetical protein